MYVFLRVNVNLKTTTPAASPPLCKSRLYDTDCHCITKQFIRIACLHTYVFTLYISILLYTSYFF